uniref:HAT C-terminal dimerisation domain-containing protein n=1 Tax=Rhizophagus irregularis (strain DAOM 181602 / DAOM 197198 / MUCL 43194) TaxID=747089 RepID=U9UFJ1_RHIID
MGSHHICLQSILASKKALQNVVFEKCVRKSIPSSLNFKLIDTEGFWVNIEEIFYDRFTKLKNEIKQLTNTSLKDIILDKYPRYHGQDLTDKYTFSMIAEETSKFVNRDLSGQLIIQPIDWWNGFQQEVPVLNKFAVKLMSIPALNAASERNWSNFGLFQNIKRNRLTSERTFKLVSIYSNLRLANGQKLNDNNKNEEKLGNLDEIIVIEESEESNIH